MTASSAHHPQADGRGEALDIEDADALCAYLRDTGRLGRSESVSVSALSGGVSNRTVLVRFSDGAAWVIKQALPRLRVKSPWFSSVARAHTEAVALQWLTTVLPPTAVTPFLFEDRSRNLLAMKAVRQPHENWKSVLLQGRATESQFEAFGRTLAAIHRSGIDSAETIPQELYDRSGFTSLRIEPYYRYVARTLPRAEAFLDTLVTDTLELQTTVVHGDFSPKNVLIAPSGSANLVLLDHEVLHVGDPAFDIGFALAHLVSKAHHLPAHRAALNDGIGCFWQAYSDGNPDILRDATLHRRVIRHALACLLARVIGRSQLEYLSAYERFRQREAVLGLLDDQPAAVPELAPAVLRRASPSSRRHTQLVLRSVSAREILDSRGRPTVEATCVLENGASGVASIPSGVSTGSNEAVEVRDADPLRYRGLGCLTAAAHVNTEIAAVLVGQSLTGQEELDSTLIEIDDTPDKSRLGANALLAVSVAFARATASSLGRELFEHFADQAGTRPALPQLTVNLFSGGAHGGGQVSIQDVLLVPPADVTTDTALARIYEVYQCASQLIAERYGARPLRADEGGLAPPVDDPEDLLDCAREAIERAGFTPGVDMSLAVDIAASHFYRDGAYWLTPDRAIDALAMIDTVTRWATVYPVVSVEDGLAEGDWTHWPKLRAALHGRALTLGDDLLCSNPSRVARAIELSAADALLLKVNQVGTLTEALTAMRVARSSHWHITLSARSGETEDNWLADLAVGWATDQIKIGSITQSERLAKYNRLLAIEQQAFIP